MERSDIFTRPLLDVLLEADHNDLEWATDPRGRAHLDRWVRKTVPAFDPMFEDPAVERMREAWARNTLLDEGGDALFEIRAEVGDKGPNGRVDVAKIETLLEASGALDLTTLKGPTGLFAAGKGAAIRAFQRANGLGEDGQVWRNGPTIRALKAALKPKIRQAVAARAKAAAEARLPGDGTPEQRPPTQLAQTRPSGAELERAASELEGYTPDRHAFFERTGKWPNNEAWKEIEFAKAKPNVTINPPWRLPVSGLSATIERQYSISRRIRM